MEDERERRAAVFRDRYQRLVPTPADQRLCASLQPDAETVIAAIEEAAGQEGLPAMDSQALREALTLASLLGRRAALLDASPSAALALAPAVVTAIPDALRSAELEWTVQAAAVDGYVRGREERERTASDRRAAEAIPIVQFAPGCVAVFVRGRQDAEELERVFADVGRLLLDRDVKACVIDATGLLQPERELAAQLFSMHVTCVMLGVPCIYAGVPDAFCSLARERGMVLDDVRFASDWRAAMQEALGACGLELREPRLLARALRRFWGQASA